MRMKENYEGNTDCEIYFTRIDMIKQCGIILTKLSANDASDVCKKCDDREWIKFWVIYDSKNSMIPKLVRDNGSIFMASKFNVGHTKLISHHIQTSGPRQPMNLERKILELIKNIFDTNIIRPCESP